MADTNKRVLIVGGGLAGMACAVALAARGIGVTLLEARHALGGRASSFDDPESSELLDNCQHVLLGCCTNLLDLYDRLGVRDKVRFHKRVHFLDPAGNRHDLFSIPLLPAPLHLGPAMGLFSALSSLQRAAVVRAMLAMLRLGRSGRACLEGIAFGDWLKDHGQRNGLIETFYDPIVISALNEETRKASAKYAIQVFQEAMLAHRRGYVVGLPACPLGELYAKLPPGVDLRLDTRVEEILWEHSEPKRDNPEEFAQPVKMRAAGIKLRGGEELHADAVVLATNHHAVQRWVTAGADAPVSQGLTDDAIARDGRFAGLEKLESVPILGAHLWFDQPVMREHSAALIGGPLQWLFRKDRAGKVLHGVISAARGWPEVPKVEALAAFAKQILALYPASGATLQRGVIVIEKRATFSPTPGTDALRPAQAPPAGGVENLYLAGDYTKTDWPATMEGAVRSGYLAAEALLERWGMMKERVLVPDLPVQWPARVMGLAK